ncbi:MAG: glycosyltransferase family 2 protein [Gammaproteobacteria bacterium]|jgi:cellulose synthase/poly-beta-1,6-N-acetylglucosamine synthase-like glycosyltransferase
MGHREQLDQIKQYLLKHQRYPCRIDVPPSVALGLVVVIPCYDEPCLISTLESLWACQDGSVDIEVIVVINASRHDQPIVHARNDQTFAQAKAWILAREIEARRRGIAFHLTHYHDLPSRHAGVGLARKIGMDAAAARFCLIGKPDGVIVSLDADCVCDPNYLQQIAAHFASCPSTSGCSIYFEHPLDSAADVRSRHAIVNYELFLRYYKHGLKQAGSPYAHYTLGSGMAVRSSAYVQQGGMNRRRAGEDFYFLQQLMRGGRFTELGSTRVLPSARVSQRVPFGTGRAIEEQLNRRRCAYLTYSPHVFRDLALLFCALIGLSRREQRAEDWLHTLPVPVAEFLHAQGFIEQFPQMRSNAASPQAFLKRFHHWFNGLRSVRYARWATTSRYGWVPIEHAAAVLLRSKGLQRTQISALLDAEALLNYYRQLDRVTY